MTENERKELDDVKAELAALRDWAQKHTDYHNEQQRQKFYDSMAPKRRNDGPRIGD
jgi:hypothetical protein